MSLYVCDLLGSCRGSALYEAAAAGCAVVTGSCGGMVVEVADLNHVALAAAEEGASLAAEAPNQASQEGPRCENPTPTRASGYASQVLLHSKRVCLGQMESSTRGSRELNGAVTSTKRCHVIFAACVYQCEDSVEVIIAATRQCGPTNAESEPVSPAKNSKSCRGDSFDGTAGRLRMGLGSRRGAACPGSALYQRRKSYRRPTAPHPPSASPSRA